MRPGVAGRLEPPRDGPDIPGAVELLSLLPTKAHGDNFDDFGNIVALADEHAATQCVICIAAFNTGESVTHLPCSHTFHAHCISPWLRRSRLCPLCKTDVYSMTGVGAIAETSAVGALSHTRGDRQPRYSTMDVDSVAGPNTPLSAPSQRGNRWPQYSPPVGAVSVNDHDLRGNHGNHGDGDRAVPASNQQFVVVNELASTSDGGVQRYGDPRAGLTPSPLSDTDITC